MSNSADALTLAQDYIRSMENQDLDAVADVLAPNARQVFVLDPDPAHPSAVYDGKDQIVAYSAGLFQKFERLTWINKEWTMSADGSRVFLQAQSDGVAKHSGAAYRNTYIFRIDIADGLIVQILEYTRDDLFVALQTPVFDCDRQAIALAKTLPYDVIAASPSTS